MKVNWSAVAALGGIVALWVMFVAALMLLSGCAGDRLQAKEVLIPVAVACVPDELPKAPEGLETRASLHAIPDPAERYRRMAVDWAVRAGWMTQAAPVVEICRQSGTVAAVPH